LKRVILAVTNDLHTDQRLHKVCSSLSENDFKVHLIGRKLDNKKLKEQSYSTFRFNLLFNTGFLFYANYNLALFIKLLFIKGDIFVSNDLDSLPAVFFAARIRRKKLVVDLHELFPESPEIYNRKVVRKFWQFIERFFLPKCTNIYTVCQSIADYYFDKFGLKLKVIRNLPQQQKADTKQTAEWPFPEEKKCILYQGATNMGRGLERLIESMQWLDAYLIIAGGGDILENLKSQANNLQLNNKIHFTGKLPFSQLNEYTALADLGISLEENLGLNYYFALPNKIFDYIRAEIPILVSPFPEMSRIVNHYDVGFIDNSTSSKELATNLSELLNITEVKREVLKLNCRAAAKELCWECEEAILLSIYQ